MRKFWSVALHFGKVTYAVKVYILRFTIKRELSKVGTIVLQIYNLTPKKYTEYVGTFGTSVCST